MRLLFLFALLAVVVSVAGLASKSWATDDAFSIYDKVMTEFQNKKTNALKSDVNTQNLTGSWSSNSPYVSVAKVVDQGGELKCIVKVPNGGNQDMYHAAGANYSGQIVLSHFSTSGAQLFIGTLSGTTMTGDLSLYGPNNQFIAKYQGIVFVKNVSPGSVVSSAHISGNWLTNVLSSKAIGEVSSTVINAVGEDVALLSGVVKVFYGITPSPYSYRGYLLNSGEVFLWNSNGVDVRTFLGSYTNGQMVGTLEQDAVDASAGVVIKKTSMPIAPVLLLEDQ